MADTTKLVQSYLKYKQKRAEIKARQRRELEEELEAWKADVGDEIGNVRRQGLSVADVCNAIGNQNRTFVYDMIGASARRNGEAYGQVGIQPVVPTQPYVGNPAHEREETTYEIEYFDNVAKVGFDDDVSTEWYEIPIIDGVPDLPEEWSDHTKERRALYKDIVKAINDHDWN